MKKYILLLLVCFAVSKANAQIGYNYAQYDIGIGAASNYFFNDYAPSDQRASFIGNFTYNQTPFLNMIGELQVGSIATVPSTAFFGTLHNLNNDYASVSFRAQLQFGEFIDYSGNKFANFMKNIYISGGVGVIYNNFKYNDSGITYMEVKSSNVFLPVKTGYEIKFFNSYSEPTVKLDLGYQLNYIMTDNYDTVPYGRFFDAIGQWSATLKIAIGGGTSYRKSINY